MDLATNIKNITDPILIDYLNTNILNNDPFKKPFVENYKYAQLNKKINSDFKASTFAIPKSLLDTCFDISSQPYPELDLLKNLQDWNFHNADSVFRTGSLVGRKSIQIKLDNFKESILLLDLTKIQNNIVIDATLNPSKVLIIVNANRNQEIPQSIFINSIQDSNLEIVHIDICNKKSFLYFQALLEKGSSLSLTTIQNFNNHIRNEFYASLDSECNFSLQGLNFDNKGVNDNYSFIQHLKPSSSSREIFKSIVNDGAITNFQGKIYVDAKAQKTDGYQMSRSLLLDNLSKANNKPELEIYADDVKCSHGSTISKINQDQLYYFNTRGISNEMAKIILKKAFLMEVLNTIKDTQIKEFSINLIDSLLNGY